MRFAFVPPVRDISGVKGAPVFVGSCLAASLFLIVSYAAEDGVSLDIGFYCMANALGHLFGTMLSECDSQSAGRGVCLWISAITVTLAATVSTNLPTRHQVDANGAQG